jgi:hypothetical protein
MKEELIARLKEISQEDKVLGFVNEFNELVSNFYKIQEEEERQWEIIKAERIEAGTKPEAIEKPVFEYLEEFRKLSTLFKDKKKIEVNALKDVEKENLQKKQALIAALSDLIQNEENIGRAINRFRDIERSWKDAGVVPRDKRQSIQKEFSTLVESFQYNINIYKEIKDHDLSRNLKLKKDVITALKELTKLDRIKDIETKLHSLQEDWNAIGGTSPKDWEVIKKEYWDVVNTVYDKIHTFYKDRKEERAENIDKKKVLVEKVKEFSSKEIDNHKLWKKNTDAVIALQEEWKTIGYGPKEENNAVWKEFRGACNEFFAKKKAFYGERNEEFDGIKEKKEKLIAEVEALRESTDWKETTKKVVAIQKRWKEVGSAGPKNENKLWKKFRGHIDFFFNAKEAHFNKADEANKDNLKAKQNLIKKIKAFKVTKDTQKTIEALKEFSSKFAEIGNVPFKKKDEIYKSYKEALDEKYNALDVDKEEKAKILFQGKLDSILGSGNQEYLLDKERGFIKTKIGKLNNEILQQETNMSFFANADESNPLFKSVMGNMQKVKDEIDGLKEQLKMIRVAEQAEERKVQSEEE